MKTKLKLIILLSLIIYGCQKNNFNKVIEFVIFDEQSPKIEDVKSQPFTTIDNKEIKSLLINSKELNETFLWKGFRLARVTYQNGDISFLKISNYQGVFLDITNNQLYQIPKQNIELWDRLLN